MLSASLHCTAAPGTEERAISIADWFAEERMKTFFDLQNLDEISEEQLVADVKQSKCLVTILDTETFRSPWVVLENQTAVDHGIRIVIFFDGDKYAWNDLSFWLKDFPQFFKTPAVEYHRAYHRESKAVLIAKVKGEIGGRVRRISMR